MFAVRAFNVELARVSVSTAYVPNKSRDLGAGSHNLQHFFPKSCLFILCSDIQILAISSSALHLLTYVMEEVLGGGGTREARVT